MLFNVSQFPDWVHICRLLITFLLTSAFGIHAFYNHKREVVDVASARRWMYWLYSLVFLGVSIANFTQLCVTIVFRDYEKASFHLGYFTLMLILSYAALIAGARQRGFD